MTKISGLISNILTSIPLRRLLKIATVFEFINTQTQNIVCWPKYSVSIWTSTINIHNYSLLPRATSPHLSMGRSASLNFFSNGLGTQYILYAGTEKNKLLWKCYVYPAKYYTHHTAIGHDFLKWKKMRFQLHMSVYKNMIVCHTFMESTLRFEKYQTNDGHWKGSVLKKKWKTME